MRPPEFTGGNASTNGGVGNVVVGFNEAAGIHRRKPAERRVKVLDVEAASMRPPEFTGGNGPMPETDQTPRPTGCFNEAAGIHRRKLWMPPSLVFSASVLQ